ncbi:hypothetical protein ACH4ZU_37030 [Streptomyces sp. NPDC020472]|uniref:hypothetical protein n=1 Tax=Streptomyces sp. NPDC020472 TaxID=3365075 RepID=UPI003789134A
MIARRESLPGITEALGNLDGWLLRDGACWLVTRHPSRRSDHRQQDRCRALQVLADHAAWPDPATDGSDTYCSPLPVGALAISGRQTVTVQEPDGTVRWEHRHETWPDSPDASGACTPDPAGQVLLATVAGPFEPGRTYAGDICRALDLATGEVLAEHVLPSFSATYAFQQFPDARPEVLLTASTGQDGAHCLLIAYTAAGLEVRPAGSAEEPYAGLGADGVLISQGVGGGYLCRTQDGAADVVIEAGETLPEGWVFAGYTPGFVDEKQILAVAAEEQWAEEGTHLLLDAHTLRPLAELDYPETPGGSAVPLGDGTWLTHDEETVLRWATA